MKKRDEIADPNSCLNKARDNEIIFVLLERDDAYADTVEYWAKRRVELGKNKPSDGQVTEARASAILVRRRKEEADDKQG